MIQPMSPKESHFRSDQLSLACVRTRPQKLSPQMQSKHKIHNTRNRFRLPHSTRRHHNQFFFLFLLLNPNHVTLSRARLFRSQPQPRGHGRRRAHGLEEVRPPVRRERNVADDRAALSGRVPGRAAHTVVSAR